MAKVFIGVGHGGMDSGALGGGLREADVNLVMALTMAEELRWHGVQAAMSRTRDENDPLEEEITEANAYGPDLAIDVHNNAGGGDGFECYIQTNQHAKMSRAFGEALERQVKALGQNSRGVKVRTYAGGDYYGFLRRVKAPAVLVEGAFLDTADRQIIDTVEKQQAFGRAYAKAALEVLGIPWQKPQEDQGLREKVEALEREKAALAAKILAAKKALG